MSRVTAHAKNCVCADCCERRIAEKAAQPEHYKRGRFTHVLKGSLLAGFMFAMIAATRGVSAEWSLGIGVGVTVLLNVALWREGR